VAEGRSGEGEAETVEREERYINLGAKNSAPMKAGDRIIICTPGGGGWGKVGDEKAYRKWEDPQHGWKRGSHSAREDAALQV